jgi:hypothetical protein
MKAFWNGILVIAKLCFSFFGLLVIFFKLASLIQPKCAVELTTYYQNVQ